MNDQNDLDFPFVEIIRNYPNQVFRSWSEYNASKRALLKADLRFLRDEFTGETDEMCLALQKYVEAFMARERADQELNEYMESIGDTSLAYWDHEIGAVIYPPPLTQEQKDTKAPLLAESHRCHAEQTDTRTDLLYRMYGRRRDEDDDGDIYGWGVYEIEDEDENKE